MVRPLHDPHGGDISEGCISPTSTASSEQQDQYVIDGGILAEQDVQGQMLYLVKWEGYGEHRNSWLPENNFQDSETLREWREKKMRITRGLDKPFDVNAFERRVQKILKDAATRKKRRRLKKSRLGSRVNSSSSSLEAAGSDSDTLPVAMTLKRRADSSTGSNVMNDEDAEDESVTSRRASLQQRPWTDQERRALEAGVVREKGPFWDRILALYGANGKINQDLKYMKKPDLQKMAFEMREEFFELGRELPPWLDSVSNYKPREGDSRPSSKEMSLEPSANQVCSRDGWRAAPGIPSRQSSPIKTQSKLPSYKGTARQDASNRAASKTPLESTASNLAAPFGPPSTKFQSKDMSLESLEPRLPENKTVSPGSETVLPPKPCEGTARAESSARPPPLGSLRRQSTSEPAPRVPAPPVRLGALGAGPARLKSTNAIPQSTSKKPKQGVKTARENGTIMPRNDSNDRVESPRLFKNLSTQNRYSKRGHEEPPPNPEKLALIDPRTRKTPKIVSPPLPVTSPIISPNTQLLDGATGVRVPLVGKQPMKQEKTQNEDMASRTPIGARHKTGDGSDKHDSTTTLERTVLDSAETQLFAADDTGKGEDVGMIDNNPPPAKASLTTGLSNPHEQEVKTSQPSTSLLLVPQESRSSEQQTSAGITLMRECSRFSKIDLYKYKAEMETSFHVMGHLKIRSQNPDEDPELYRVGLQGIDKPLFNRLMTIKTPPRTVHFELKKTCLAAELQKFFPVIPSDLFGWGYIVAVPDSQHGIDSLASKLAQSLSGALCFAPSFTMVVYPTGADAWAYLDCRLPAVPEGAVLRFVVRPPLPLEYADFEVPDLSNSLLEEDLDRYKLIIAKTAITIKNPIAKGISAVLQEFFGIDYNRLVSNKKPVFFLCFIPAGCESYEKDATKRHALRRRTSEEHDLFVDFLRENGAEVYSLQNVGSHEPNTNGSWEYFVNNVKSGVVVIHDACTRIDQIPGLATCIVPSHIDIWKFSLEPIDEDARSPHLIRLFPHGAVILLTESLMLYRPHEALRILMWFRLVKTVRGQTPGNWKLAVRVHVRPWLLDVLDVYEDTKTDVFGCGKQVFSDLYTNITWLLQHDYDPDDTDTNLIPNGMRCEEWDDETPNDEALLVAPANLQEMQSRKAWTTESSRAEVDHENIRANDYLLMQWFAQWAIVACENFRKFQVVLGYEPGDIFKETARPFQKKWGHIEILTAEKCYKRNSISPQSELDAEETKRRRINRQQAPLTYAKIEKGRKAERETAKNLLERAKAMYRNSGASKTQIRDGARLHLRQTGASLQEIKRVEIDMNLRNCWYEELKVGVADDLKRVDDVEAMLAAEREEEEEEEEENLDGDPMDTSNEAEEKGEDPKSAAVEGALARSIRLTRDFPSSFSFSTGRKGGV